MDNFAPELPPFTYTETVEKSLTVANVYGTGKIKIPEWCRAVDFRPPHVNDMYLPVGGYIDWWKSYYRDNIPRIILERIRPRRFVFVEDPNGPYRLLEANGQFVIANETATNTKSFEFTLGRNVVCRGTLKEEKE